MSRGIYSSSNFYLAVILIPTWWIPPLASLGRNDNAFFIGCYKFKCTTTPAPGAGWRQIAAATVGVPSFGWYHSPTRVIHPTQRAADCRPYIENVLYYRVLNTFDVFLPNKNGGTSVPPKKIVNCQLSIVNQKNCQLSTVNC